MGLDVNSINSGFFAAANFNYTNGRLQVGNAAAGAATVTLVEGYIVLNDGTAFVPYATNTPIIFDIGSNAETLTPSAVTNTSLVGPGLATLTCTFANVHGQGCLVQSGTFGLQEAINAANSAGGGCVTVDATWTTLGGTTAMLAAAVNGTKVTILDLRNGTTQFWAWNGTTFALAPIGGMPTILYGANGAISVASQYAILTKAGVDAMTLAAPTAAQAGTIIVITSRTANAHTVTATGLLNTGSASVNLATFAAFAGAGFTVIADNLKWNVIAQIGITFS